MPTLASLGIVIDPSGAQAGGQTVLSILQKMATAAEKMEAASESMAKSLATNAKQSATALQTVAPAADKGTAAVDKLGDHAETMGKDVVAAAGKSQQSLTAMGAGAIKVGEGVAQAGKNSTDSIAGVAAQIGRTTATLETLGRTNPLKSMSADAEALAEKLESLPPPKIVDTSGTTPTYSSVLAERKVADEQAFERSILAVTSAEEQLTAVRASATASAEQRAAAERVLAEAIQSNDAAAKQLRATEAAQAGLAAKATGAGSAGPRPTSGLASDPQEFLRQSAVLPSADLEVQAAEREAAARQKAAEDARQKASESARLANNAAGTGQMLAARAAEARTQGDVPGAQSASADAQSVAETAKGAAAAAKEMAQIAKEAYKEAADAAKAAGTETAESAREAARDAAVATKQFSVEAAAAYKEAAAAASEAAASSAGAEKDAAQAAATAAKEAAAAVAQAAKAEAEAAQKAAKEAADAAKQQAQAQKEAAQAAASSAAALQKNRDELSENAAAAYKDAASHGSLANSLQRSANVLYLFAQAAGPLSGVANGIATAFNITGMVLEKFSGTNAAAAERQATLSESTKQLADDQAALATAQKSAATAASTLKSAQQSASTSAQDLANAEERAAKAAKEVEEAEKNVAQSAKTVEIATKAAGAALGSFLAAAAAVVAILALPIFAVFTIGITAAGAAWKIFSDSISKGIAFNELHSRFSQFVGDAGAAHKALEELEELGAHSGLGLPELENATQRMLTFGAGLNEAMEETRNFALIGAASGKDALNQLENAYATARTQGQISMAEINQLKSAGIDLFSDLAKQTGFTTSQLHHLISEGVVGFATFKKTIDAATGAGGKFQHAFDIRLATPQGQLDQLSAHYDELLRHLGEPVAIALVPFLKVADDLLHGLNPQADKLGQKLREVLVIITGAAKNGDLGSLITGALTEGFGKAYAWIKSNFLDPIKAEFAKFTAGTSFGSALSTVFSNISALFEKLFKDGGTIIGANISFALDQVLEKLSSVLGLGALHDDAHYRNVDQRTADPLREHQEDFQIKVNANNQGFTDDVHKAGIALKETTGLFGALGVSTDLLNRRIVGVEIPKYIPTGRAVPREELFPPPEPAATSRPPAQHPLTATELVTIQTQQRTSAVNSFLDPFGAMGLGGGGGLLGLPGQRGRYATSPTGQQPASTSPNDALIRAVLGGNFSGTGSPAPAQNGQIGSGGIGPTRPTGPQVILSGVDLQTFLAGQAGTGTGNANGLTSGVPGKPSLVTLDPATLAILQSQGGLKLEGSDAPLTQQQMAVLLRDGLIIKQLPATDPLLNPLAFANLTSLDPVSRPNPFSLSTGSSYQSGPVQRAPLSLNSGVYSGNLAKPIPDSLPLPDVTVTPSGPANGLFPTGGLDMTPEQRKMFMRLPGNTALPIVPSVPPIAPPTPATPTDSGNTAAVQANTAAIQANTTTSATTTHSLTGVASEFGYLYKKGPGGTVVGSIDDTDKDRKNWDGEAHYGSPVFGRQNIADPNLMGVALSEKQVMDITGIQDDWKKAAHALDGVSLTVTNLSNGLTTQVHAADIGPGHNPGGKEQVEVTGAVNKQLQNIGGGSNLSIALSPGANLNVAGTGGHAVGGSFDDVVRRAKATGEQVQPNEMPHNGATPGTDPMAAMGNGPSDLKAIQNFLEQVKGLTAAYDGGSMELAEYTRRMNDLRSKTLGSLQNPMGGVTTATGPVKFTTMVNQGYGALPLTGKAAADSQDSIASTHRAEMQQLEVQQKEAEDRMRTNDEGYFNSFVAGMSKAVSSAGTLQQTIGKIGQTVVSDLGSGIAGALQSIADGSATAAQAFRKMASSMLADIAKMIIEFALLALIKNLAGVAGGAATSAGYGGLGSALTSFSTSGVHHTGGIAGSPMVTRMVSPEIFNGATRYHTGGMAGLMPGETPIIAQTGEGIFTQDQMAALAPAGGQTTNNNSVANQYHSEIHVHQDGTTSSNASQGNSDDAQVMGAALDSKIKSVLVDETTRQGGIVHDYLHGSARNS